MSENNVISAFETPVDSEFYIENEERLSNLINYFKDINWLDRVGEREENLFC